MVFLIRIIRFLLVFGMVLVVLFGSAHADSPKSKILLVDDDMNYNGYDYRSYFVDAIEANGYLCDTIIGVGDCDIVISDLFSPYNGPDFDTMVNYDIVVWFTGDTYGVSGSLDTYPTLTSSDMQNLEDYLDDGGTLFLTGQDIGFDIGQQYFYLYYLKSYFLVDDAKMSHDYALPNGIADDVITHDLLDLNIYSPEGAVNQMFPSIIEPFGSNVNEIFHYTYYDACNQYVCKDISPSDDVAAVRVDTGIYKLVYFAFGFEGLGSYNRNLVMNRLLKYLSPPSVMGINLSSFITNTDPVIYAICRDFEKFSYVNGAEYFVDSVLDKSYYGSGNVLVAHDGAFNEMLEVVNGTVDISILSDGNHTVYVHCQDISGYWGNFDSFNFTVDRVAPNAPLFVLVDSNEPYTNEAFPVITIQAPLSDVPDYMRFSCNDVNFTGWVDFDSSYYDFNVTDPEYGCPLSDGHRDVHVSVKDIAGNIQSSVKDTDGVTLDRVVPLYVIEDFYPENNSFVAVNVNISYNVTDDQLFSKVIYNAGGVNYTTFDAAGLISTWWSVEGWKLLDLWVYDEAGNVNHTFLRYFVDANAPVFYSVEPVNNSYVRSADNLTVVVGDDYGISSFWYNNNVGGGNVTVAENSSFSPNWGIEGEQFIDVWANDSAGNVNHARYRFVVDNSPPSISNISYVNESYVTSISSFFVNTTDNNGVNLRYYDNGSGLINNTFFDGVSFVPGWFGDGWNDLVLWVVDAAGNVLFENYSYFVDDTSPYVVSVNPLDGSYIRSVSNITIDVDDSGVGIDVLLYRNSTTLGWSYNQFSDNVGFNPGWTSEVTNYLVLKMNDTLGNTRSLIYHYVVDDTSPVFGSVNPLNGSYVSFRTNITVAIYDTNALDKSWFNNGSLNVTFDPSFSFNPEWNVGGVNDIYVWVNDSAGNVNATYYRFLVDDSPPVITIISPANGSFIDEDDVFNIISQDEEVSVDEVWYFNGSGMNQTISDGIGFLPEWSVDGNHMLEVWSNDTLGNVNHTVFGFYFDTTGPNTSSNQTSFGWVNENIDVLLSCDDAGGVGCDITHSCVRYSGSTVCVLDSVLNVVGVECPVGQTCQKIVSFWSNDSLGNIGPVNETGVFMIDKEAPSIIIQNPKSMQVVSGMVDILASVSDLGVGVNASWYDINQTVANGTLNLSGGWDALWNSSESSNGFYNLTVYANDSFGYLRLKSIVFEVDNNLPAAVIHYPREDYISGGFNLDLRASRVGGNLSNCSYYVYNSSNVLNFSFKSVSSSLCNFTGWVDTSLWNSGNYSINFTAFDVLGNNVSEEEWFIFDVDSPDVFINNPSGGEWTKDVVKINYTTNDDYLDTCYFRYKDGSEAFSGYNSIACGSLIEFEFDTGAYCSDTNSSECFVEVNSTDKAGNSNVANVSFNVDNSLPVVSILNPAANSWHNGTFTVDHSEIDLQGQSCGYRVNGSSDTKWVGVICGDPFDVIVSSFCLNEGVSACRVNVNSTNNVGGVTVKSRVFSVDFVKPYFVSLSRPNGSFLKSNDNIRIDVNDSLSGLAQLMYDNGTGGVQVISDNVYFNPGWTTDGYNVLNVWVSDIAGNVNYSLFSYFVDDSGPYVVSANPDNGSNFKLGDNIIIDVDDAGVGLGLLKFNNDEYSGTVSFVDNVSFDPLWDSGGNKTIILWLKDSLGNLNHTTLRYFVDTYAPSISVSISNGSIMRLGDNITVDVVDIGVGVDVSSYNNGSGLNATFMSGVSFNPGWVDEGAKQIIFYANDSFANVDSVQYAFVVDGSAPVVHDAWTDVLVVKAGEHVTVSVNVSDNYSSIGHVFVDVLNTTLDFVDRVELNYSGFSSVYNGTIVIDGEDTGNYTLNMSLNDSVGWLTSLQIEIIVDNSLPVVGGSMFDIDVDALYVDKRIYQNEFVSFVVNVSDRQVDSVVVTVDAPYGQANYSLLPLSGNYSYDTWNFTLHNTSMLGGYRVSALYVNDSLGNTKIIVLNLDEFLVVSGGFFVSINGSGAISAYEDRSIDITFGFNRTLDNPNMTLFVPVNTPLNNTHVAYFENNSVFSCVFGAEFCAIDTSLDVSGRVALLNVSGNSMGSMMTVYSDSVTALYPVNDSNMTWYLGISNHVYSNYTLVKTPFLNVSSVLCDGVSACIVNQGEEFVLNTTVVNVNMAGNHTGDVYGVIIDANIGPSLLQLNRSLGDIDSGMSRTTSWQVNVTAAGNYTMSIVAVDVTSRYNSSIMNVSLVVKDTETPSAYNPFLVTPSSIYPGESASIGVWAVDNVNISNVWATIRTANGTNENVSFYLDLGNRKVGIWKLVYNKTHYLGSYNLTYFYANDTSGNLNRVLWGSTFEVLNLTLSSSLSIDVLNVSSGVIIYANVSSNATAVENVEAVITKPRNWVEVVELVYAGNDSNGTYLYEFYYENVSRSGNYSVNVTVSSRASVTETERFYANFGNLDVVFSEQDSVIVVPFDSVFNVSWFIVPVGGDLLDVNLSVNIENSTVMDIINGDFNASLGNVTVEDNPYGYIISWQVNASSIGVSNMTVLAESVSSGVFGSSTIIFNVTPLDIVVPNISLATFAYEILNLYETNALYVNVTDDSLVDNVSFEVHYPQGAVINHTAVVVGSGRYRLDFSNVSEVGVFTCRIYSYDISGNLADLDCPFSFNSSDVYDVSISMDHATYNKGETIFVDLLVKNVNNITVTGHNLTLVLNDSDSLEYLANNEVKTLLNKSIAVYDMPIVSNRNATYFLNASVYKNGNLGNDIFNITVHSSLITEITSLSFGAYYKSGNLVPINVTVSNMRGEGVSDARITATYQSSVYELTYLTSNVYVLENYFAPYDSSFGFNFNAIDSFKNGGWVSITLTTVETVLSPSSPGGGGNAGGAAGATAIDTGNLSDTALIMPERLLKNNFDFTIRDTKFNVIAGDDVTFYGSITNIGDMPLVINTKVWKDCCDVLVDEVFDLSVGGGFDFPVTVHVPLNTIAGDYIVQIEMLSGGLRKLNTVRLDVDENPNLIILERMKYIYLKMKSDLDRFEEKGFDVRELKNKVSEVERLLAVGQSAVVADDVILLVDVVEDLESRVGAVDSEIFMFKLKYFMYENKERFLFFLVIIAFSISLLTEIVIPYMKLRDILVELNKKRRIIQKTKKSAEKQYFMRMISEQVFNSIVVAEQNKLLKTKSEIAEIEEYIDLLKKGKVKEFKKMKADREGRHKNSVKMKAMEHTLNMSTRDYLAEKIKNSRIAVFYEKLKRLIRKVIWKMRGGSSSSNGLRDIIRCGSSSSRESKKAGVHEGYDALENDIDMLKKAISDEYEKKKP